MSEHIIVLADRVKELSRTTGSGNLQLDGAATGFSSFADSYTYNDAVFYAVTDGINYEVGSGQYILDGSTDALTRFPHKSSNSDNIVNFPNGVKEVYVTYPGKYAVMTAGGLDGFDEPDASGLAFWGSNQLLNYDSNVVWDKDNTRLGINNAAPTYTIDIGGEATESSIRVSGLIVGSSGVTFSNAVQLTAYTENALDATTGTDAVLELSGVSNQIIKFQEQNAGLFFSGPPSGCNPSGACAPDYPSFRAITDDDLPSLSHMYLTQEPDAYTASGMESGVGFWADSGVMDHDPYFVWDKANNYLGVNKKTPTVELDVNGDATISGQIITGGDVIVGGTLNVKGNFTYVDSTTVTIADHQIELASVSGNATLDDSQIDDAGIVIKSTDSDKKFTWRDATDAWTSTQAIDVPSVIFDDSSVISGAYHAGSGLEIHNGIEINIADVFKVAGNDAITTNILQADTLAISGISGVSVSVSTNGAVKTMLINPSVLIGNLEVSGNDNSAAILANSASGVAISGYLQGEFNALENETDINTLDIIYHDNAILANSASGVAISGWAAYTIDASGEVLDTLIDAVSGYAKAYTDGVSFDAGNGWILSDMLDNTETITNNTVTISGVSGINTFYDAADDNMIISAESIQSDITLINTNILANSASGVAISGWAGTVTTDLQSQITDVSGWAAAGGTSLSAGTGLMVNGSSYHTSGIGYFSNIRSYGISDPVSLGSSANTDGVNGVFIGRLSGNGTTGDMSETVAIGYNAAQAASETNGGVFVGPAAGLQASGNDGCVGIGDQALGFADECYRTVGIGHFAGKESVYSTGTVFVGMQAGQGCYKVNSSLGLGQYSLYQSSDVSSSLGLGQYSLYQSSDVSSSISIGYGSMYSSSGVDYDIGLGYDVLRGSVNSIQNIAMGSQSMYQVSGVGDTIGIGRQAGYQVNNLDYNLFIGFNAGYRASGDGYSNFIGYKSGYTSKTDLSNLIGHEAGSNMGYYSTTYPHALSGVVALGSRAAAKGRSLNNDNRAVNSNLVNAIFIGEEAGYNTNNVDGSIIFGKRAGSYDWNNSFTNDKEYTINKSVVIGYYAAFKDDNNWNSVHRVITNSFITGHQAAYDILGNISDSIIIGSDAGAVSSGAYNIFLGKNVGSGIGGSNNIILGSGKQTGLVNNIINLNDTIVAYSTDHRYTRIGDSKDLSDTATLSIKPAQTDQNVLNLLHGQSAPTVDMMVAQTGASPFSTGRNAVINKNGFLRIPSFANVSAATAAVSATTNEGVLLFAGDSILVSDGSVWFSGAMIEIP